jgi:hypothetical protein
MTGASATVGKPVAGLDLLVGQARGRGDGAAKKA